MGLGFDWKYKQVTWMHHLEHYEIVIVLFHYFLTISRPLKNNPQINQVSHFMQLVESKSTWEI